MLPSVLKDIWGRLLVAAGTLGAGIAALFIDVKLNPQLARFAHAIVIFGGICVVAAVFEAIWAVRDGLAAAGALKWWSDIQYRFGQLLHFSDYTPAYWSGSQVQYRWSDIESVAHKAMGPDFSHGTLAREKMIAHAKKNSEFMFVLLDKNDKLAGFLNLISLNKAGTKAVLDGKIRSGHEIEVKDACKASHLASGIYIAGVYATDWRSRGALLALLKFILRNRASESVRLQGIFARGATENGKRLVTDYHFAPLKNNAEIFFLPQDQMSKP